MPAHGTPPQSGLATTRMRVRMQAGAVPDMGGREADAESDDKGAQERVHIDQVCVLAGRSRVASPVQLGQLGYFLGGAEPINKQAKQQKTRQ